MARSAHSQTYYCPYCSLAGWTRPGEVVAHVKKKHGKCIKAKDCTAEKHFHFRPSRG